MRSAAVHGIEAFPVDVEVDVGRGLPSFAIVGLPDPAVQEAKERVRAAIRNAGSLRKRDCTSCNDIHRWAYQLTINNAKLYFTIFWTTQAIKVGLC